MNSIYNNKVMFNNLNGCMIRCRKKKKNFEKISTPLNIDKKNIIFGKITISLRYLKLNSDGVMQKCRYLNQFFVT